jgi:hypothetical protein
MIFSIILFNVIIILSNGLEENVVKLWKNYTAVFPYQLKSIVNSPITLFQIHSMSNNKIATDKRLVLGCSSYLNGQFLGNII